MSLRASLLASLLFTSLALIPAGAHLLSLPNKIGMSATDYLVAQQAYAGWQFVGIAVVAALVSTALLSWFARETPAILPLALLALACVVATQVVFWTMNFPANQQTANWTQLPDHWQTLRRRWEVGHAIAALLNLMALGFLLSANWRLLKGR
jgi:hypothetical protein